MATILLVDDSGTIRMMLQRELIAGGHEVVAATCGNKAIAMLGTRRFDLVVTDIYMPDGDGIEVLTAVRKLSPRPLMIAMSSMAGDSDMLPLAKLLGAKVILPKPFAAGELLANANALLGITANV